MHPMGSKDIDVNHARSKVVRIQQKMVIQMNAVKRL
jgi:hypothetical protein